MPLKIIKRLLVPFALLVLLSISIVLLANSFIQRPSIQKFLAQRLSLVAGIEIRAGSIELDLWSGIGIGVSDFEAGPDSKGNMLKVPQMKITLDIGELMKGRIVPVSLYLLRPEVMLVLDAGTSSLQSNNAEIIENFASLWIPGIQSIFIEKGLVNITEKSFWLEDLSLGIYQDKQDPLKYKIDTRGATHFKGSKTTFRLRGTILSPSKKNEIASIDMMLETNETPLELIPLPKPIAIKKGKLKTNLHILGDLDGDIAIDGQAYIKPCHFSLIHSDRYKDISLPELVIDFRSHVKGKAFSAPSISLKGPGFLLGAAVKLSLEDMKNPNIEITGNSGFMPIDTFKALFPTQLLPLWLEKKLFPILIDGDIRLNLFRLKGSVEQIRNIRLPKNHSVMEMNLECDNFYIAGKGIRLPFKEVSTDISLRHGTFQISNLRGGFGVSRVDEACLDITDVYSKTPYFETSIDGSFRLEELIRQKEIEFIPLNIRNQLDEIETLSGDLRCRTVIGYEYGWDFLKILRGEFLSSNCLLDQEKFLYPLLISNGEVLVLEDNLNRFSGNGSWGDSPFSISGNFSIFGKDLEVQNADLFANVDMSQLIPFVQKSPSPPFKFNTPVALQVSAARNADSWSLLGTAGLQGSVIENDTFQIATPGKDDYLLFDINYKPNRRTVLKKSIARIGASSIFISGSFDPVDTNVINLDLSSSHLSMEDMGFRVKSMETPVKGTLDVDIRIDVPLGKDGEVKTKGRLKGENLYMDPGIFNSPIKEGDFILNISGKQADIDSLNFKIGKSDISITGNLEGWDHLKGDISIDSSFLDTADIMPLESSSVMGTESESMDGLMKKLNLDIDLNISKGYWRELKWEQLEADLNLLSGALFINRSNIYLDHGSLDIKGHILGGVEPDMAFNAIILLNEQPVDKLLEDIRFDFQGLKGDLTMAAKLYMRGKNKEDLIPSLTGAADISIKTGLIKNPNTFIKVLDDLSLQNIFKERPPDLREDGLFFESIQAEAEINNGIIRSENFTMRSPVFNAVAYGESDLDKKTVDFILATQPHGTIDMLVSSIPIVGFIITGEDRSVLAYTFEVKGLISDPTVTFIPIEGVGRSVGGILERLLTTPERIMKDIQEGSGTNQEKIPGQSNQGLYIPNP